MNERLDMKPVTKCPDCETEYPKAAPGGYRCPKCYCKFQVEPDQSMKIIPYFEEISLEPILVILGVLSLVLLISLGNLGYSVVDRIKLIGVIVLIVLGIYKLIEYGCRRYRKVDRFFRKMSRFGFDAPEDGGLIKLKNENDR